MVCPQSLVLSCKLISNGFFENVNLFKVVWCCSVFTYSQIRYTSWYLNQQPSIFTLLLLQKSVFFLFTLIVESEDWLSGPANQITRF